MMTIYCFFFILTVAVTSQAQQQQSSLRGRRLQGTAVSPTCPGLEDISQALPAQEVHRAAIAAKLSALVYTLDDYPEGDPVDYSAIDSKLIEPIFYESADGVDGVLMTNYDNRYCMAVYRGTQPELWQSGGRDDWLSNMDLRESTIPYNNNNVCHVHKGYHEAYTQFEYRDNVEQYLRDCHASCPNCDMVMTGHSQGGSIAVIAAIEWMLLTIQNDNDNMQQTPTVPFVVTFGAPQGLGTGCRGLLKQLGGSFSTKISCQWFHYIMSTAGTFGLTYDAVPMVFPHLLKGLAAYAKADNDLGDITDEGFAFVGHELLVSTQQVDSVLYIGLDQHRFDMPYSARAHWDWLYRDVMMDLWTESQDETSTSSSPLYNSGNGNDNNGINSDFTATSKAVNPVPTHGFSLGSLCNVDQECISHRCQKESFLSWKKACV